MYRHGMISIVTAMGVVPSPFDCWLVTRGLKTLPCRLKEHQTSSIEIGNFLESHPCVEKVLHPGTNLATLVSITNRF